MSASLAASVCPHDCPSQCAVSVELKDTSIIGRVHGRAGHPYTDGVVCAKVARYAERQHHPDRLKHPLIRTGANGQAAVPRRMFGDILSRIDGFRATPAPL